LSKSLSCWLFPERSAPAGISPFPVDTYLTRESLSVERLGSLRVLHLFFRKGNSSQKWGPVLSQLSGWKTKFSVQFFILYSLYHMIFHHGVLKGLTCTLMAWNQRQKSIPERT
jgi:hypothetical protein